MCSAYVESYKDLFHGTTKENADNIIKSQTFIPSKRGWCGEGVYFYDSKAKAWWSANRTVYDIKKKENKKATPDIIIVDIKEIEKKDILDLRSYVDLKRFADFTNSFLEKNNFDIDNCTNDEDKIKLKREMLLSFFCLENGIKLIIGYFKQNTQDKYEQMKKFSDDWELAIGIEVIYCVKDLNVIYNIRGREING